MRFKKLSILPILASIIVGMGVSSQFLVNKDMIEVSSNDFSDTDSKATTRNSAGQGGANNGKMRPHREDKAVLDTWWEYTLNDSKGSYDVAVNYNLRDDREDEQSYKLGIVINNYNGATNTILNNFESSLQFTGVVGPYMKIRFHSKYWASMPVNGINYSDPETLTLNKNIKYHPATAAEANAYNSKFGSSEWGKIKEGEVLPIDPVKHPGVFVLDGVDTEEEMISRQYGINNIAVPTFNINEFAASPEQAAGSFSNLGDFLYGIGPIAPWVEKTGVNASKYYDTTKDANVLNENIAKINYGRSAYMADNDIFSFIPQEYPKFTTEEEWHKYFSEDAVSLFGGQYSSGTKYRDAQHIIVDMPVKDRKNDLNLNDHFGLTKANTGKEGQYDTNFIKGSDILPNAYEFYFNALSTNDALSLAGIDFYSYRTSVSTGATNFQFRVYSGVNKYMPRPDNNGNQEMLLSYPNPKFSVDIKGYDENNDFIVDVKYDHTPTPISYSNVNYIEYIMMGPNTPQETDQVIWDHIIIGDNWAFREHRTSINDTTIIEDPDFYNKLGPEWKDNNADPNMEGEFDKDGNFVGGYPTDNDGSPYDLPEYPDVSTKPDGDYLGDMNIAGEEAINETINYGGLFYGEDPSQEDMKYTFTSRISVTPTSFGKSNAFLPGANGEEILSQYDEKLILPGPTAPIVTEFNLVDKNRIDLQEINPDTEFNIKFAGDSKSSAENDLNNKVGLQQTGLVSVQAKAYQYDYIDGILFKHDEVDLTEKLDITETQHNGGFDGTWNYDEAEGGFSGETTAKTGVLQPNKDYMITLDWVYGEGVFENEKDYITRITGDYSDEADNDKLYKIHTSSVGVKTPEVSNTSITDIPADWGKGDWNVKYNFDYSQAIPSDATYGEDAYDDAVINKFEIINNAGEENESTLVTKDVTEVIPDYDPSVQSYNGLSIDIPAISLLPDTEFNLTLRVTDDENETYDSPVATLDPINGPDSAAPTVSNVSVTGETLDKETRVISADATLDIDVFTMKEAIAASWTGGSPTQVSNIEFIDRADSDKVLGTVEGSTLGVDEQSDGIVKGVKVHLDDLKANWKYDQLAVKVNFGNKGEAPYITTEPISFETHERGIADIVVGEPTVEGFTKVFNTKATVDISFATGKGTSFDFKDFTNPGIKKIDIVDTNDGNKVLGTASAEEIAKIVYGEADKTNISIDLAIPKNNTTYTLGVIATASDDTQFTSSNVTGVTDPSEAFEPEVKPMSINAADGDSVSGYINTEFTFDIRTQTLPGVDNVETSESLLTSVSITIYKDEETEAETHDLSDQIATGKTTVDGDFTTTTFTFKSDVGVSYLEGDYKYVVSYEYGEVVDDASQSGSQEDKVSFKENGIDGVVKEDITITNASAYQTGFSISGEIKNDPEMFWKSYSVTRVTIIDDNGMEINEGLIESKLMNEDGDVITEETGPLAPGAEGNLSGKFEINVFGILPQAPISNYSLEIINDDEEVPAYKQKLGDTENVFTADGNDFVNTDEDNKDTEVIDDVSVTASYKDLETVSPTEENGLTTGSVTFTLTITNTTSLTLDNEITLSDSDGNEYRDGDGNTKITPVSTSTKTGTQEFEVSIENLEAGKTYDGLKVSFMVIDTKAPDAYQVFESNLDVEDLIFDIGDLPEQPEPVKSNLWWIILIVIIVLLLIELIVLLILWLLRSLRVTETIEQSNGTATFLISRDSDSKVAAQINGRTLRGTQGDNESELKYSVVSHESGKLAIALTGISNDEPIKGLVFLADASSNSSLEAKYEADIKAYESDLAKWEEAKAKAKEAEQDFNQEKPAKPAKPEIEKDIKVSGSVITSLETEKAEKTVKEKKSKSQAEFSVE